MIITHVPSSAALPGMPMLDRRQLPSADPIPADVLWIDLVEPTREEDRKLEKFLGISIPTREEMEDIEPSELLYNEDGARYMTARLLCRADSETPGLTGVTFILKENVLVTVRYDEPRSFAMYAARACRPGGGSLTSEGVLSGLIETISDRAADVLQMAGEKIDAVSRAVFDAKGNPGKRAEQYQTVLKTLGRLGELISKQRESLVSVERILLFLSVSYRAAHVPKELRDSVRATQRDLQSLEEHATFLSNKIQFLLDATLGLVNLEQNNIIKLFSVVAVIFLPPTLIASIYGMNFKVMPELDWSIGYPAALFMMLVAAVLPYAYFRWRGWL